MNSFLWPKRTAQYATFIAAIALALSFSTLGCKKDDSNPVNPASARDKMIGSYLVKSNHCAAIPLNVGDPFMVRAGAGPNDLDLDGVFVATVSGSTFTIPKTTGGGLTQTGKGTFSGGVITITFEFEATPTTPAGTCILELQKQ